MATNDIIQWALTANQANGRNCWCKISTILCNIEVSSFGNLYRLILAYIGLIHFHDD